VLAVGNGPDDGGNPYLGYTFDNGDRKSFGIPRQMVGLFVDRINAPPAKKAIAIARVLAHELTHVFNLHHNDWGSDGSKFPPDQVSVLHNSTLEGLALLDISGWRLRDKSANILQSEEPALHMPGPYGLPFNCISKEHRDQHQKTPEDVTVTVTKTADGSGYSSCAPHSDAAGLLPPGGLLSQGPQFGLFLSLQGPSKPIHLGDYVSVESTLKNTGTHIVVAPTNLSVEAGTLRLWIKGPNERDYHQYLPPAFGDLAKPAIELQTHQHIVGDAPIFFSSTGWTLLTVGTYEVQATSTVEVDQRDVVVASNPIQLEVLETTIDCNGIARELTGDARRRHNYGMLMYLGRSDTSLDLIDGIFRLAQSSPLCSQSQGINLTEAISGLHQYRTTGARSALASAADALSRVTSDQIPDAQYYALQAGISEGLEESGKSGEAKALRKRVRRIKLTLPIQPAAYEGRVLTQFYFASGSTVLPLEKIDELKELAAYLSAMNVKLHIDGFADAVGRAKDYDASNLRISVDRATAIAGYLAAAGVDLSQITVQGYGSSRSKVSENPEVQRLDRRVDLKLD
jgi:outer membrane protein OmpA-like peptidoglycan-associated protein